jgi:FixJ family two-component response regulator
MIAIVDDDEAVREATRSLVRSLGFYAATFASAEEFLESSCFGDASCVIADVQMPGMGGVELQRRLQGTGHHMPLIFITAFPEEHIRRQVKAAGAVGFLAKPFEGRCLIACIDKALAGVGTP